MTAPLPVAPPEMHEGVGTPAGDEGLRHRARGIGPVLRLVPDPAALSARIGRLPFTVLVLTLLGGGLLGLLLVNTDLAQGSFRAQERSAAVAQLEDRAQELQVEVEARETPESLARRAAALGLRPGGVPGFVRVPGGEVLQGPEGDDAPLVPFEPSAADETSADQPSAEETDAEGAGQ